MSAVRTTLRLDEDVLAAARALAEQQHKTLGEVVSELARRGLKPPPRTVTRNGIALMPVREGARPATLEQVNRLRDEAS